MFIFVVFVFFVVKILIRKPHILNTKFNTVRIPPPIPTTCEPYWVEHLVQLNRLYSKYIPHLSYRFEWSL